MVTFADRLKEIRKERNLQQQKDIFSDDFRCCIGFELMRNEEFQKSLWTATEKHGGSYNICINDNFHVVCFLLLRTV